jgi:hypothetical protein
MQPIPGVGGRVLRPPQAKPPQPKPTVHPLYELALDIADGLLGFKRALAAVIQLDETLARVDGTLSEGARERGLPLWSSPSSFGNETIEVVYDLTQVDPALTPHVLAPFLDLKHRELQQEITALEQRLGAVKIEAADRYAEYVARYRSAPAGG